MIGTIVALLVALVGGGLGITTLLDGDEEGDNTAIAEKCEDRGAEALKHLDCRNSLYINSIQAYWAKALPAHFKQPYEEAVTVFFEEDVNSGVWRG